MTDDERSYAEILNAMHPDKPDERPDHEKPWRDDERGDPNFGRECMCGAAIRAGGRIGHHCRYTRRPAGATFIPAPVRDRAAKCGHEMQTLMEHSKEDLARLILRMEAARQ